MNRILRNSLLIAVVLGAVPAVAATPKKAADTKAPAKRNATAAGAKAAAAARSLAARPAAQAATPALAKPSDGEMVAIAREIQRQLPALGRDPQLFYIGSTATGHQFLRQSDQLKVSAIVVGPQHTARLGVDDAVLVSTDRARDLVRRHYPQERPPQLQRLVGKGDNLEYAFAGSPYELKEFMTRTFVDVRTGVVRVGNPAP